MIKNTFAKFWLKQFHGKFHIQEWFCHFENEDFSWNFFSQAWQTLILLKLSNLKPILFSELILIFPNWNFSWNSKYISFLVNNLDNFWNFNWFSWITIFLHKFRESNVLLKKSWFDEKNEFGESKCMYHIQWLWRFVTKISWK